MWLPIPVCIPTGYVSNYIQNPHHSTYFSAPSLPDFINVTFFLQALKGQQQLLVPFNSKGRGISDLKEVFLKKKDHLRRITLNQINLSA